MNFQMNPEEAGRILGDAETRQEIQRSCNVDARDHLHIGRVGEAGAGLAARGLIQVHEGGDNSRVFLAAPELRQVAAALLNVADEIDGRVPLSFFDPAAPSAEEPEPEPDDGRGSE